MAVAGSLIYSTEIDKNGFNKGLKELENNTQSAGTKIKNIVMALGIDKIISATMNTIKSSISSAMDRIDTMNQFTRVITVMTGSTEKANTALESIKKTVTGTAYGLDVASKSAQKLVTSGMNLEKSTRQIQTWADAVAFYGDGTNATFENVTDALSKMVAKGKVEMDQLNRLTDAGIPAVQIYADSVGRSVTQVQDDLSKGKISTEQFLDGLDKAFNDGTNKFASITGAAQEAGASWTATFDNFKAAITRGMTNIINAIDEGLKSIGLKAMREMISQVGKESEKTMNKITPLIKKGIKSLKDVYDWTKKNKDLIKTLIITVASLTAGYIAYQKVLVAIKAIQTAKNILATTSAFLSLIPTIKSAKDAMLLLNMAFLANPIGIIVAGVVALTAGITASVIAINKQKESLGGLKEEVDSQRKSWDELKKTREESLNSSSLEIATTQKLADELKTITDENGKVKEGYENRAKYILGELNSALGTEYKMNRNIISQYQDLKENIDNVIASKKAEAILEAYKSEYQVALNKKTEATKTLTDLTKKYNEQLQISEDKTKTIAERNEAQGQVEKIGKEIENQTKLISEYGYTIEQYEKLTTASISGSAEEIEKAVSNMGVSYDQAKEKANNSLASQVQAQSNYVDLIEQNLQKARDSNDKFTQNILETELNTQKEQLQNLINSFSERTSTIESLSSEEATTWAILARNNKDEYLEALENLPEETRKKVEKVVDGVKNTESLLNGTFSNLGEENKIQFGNQLKLKETVQDKMQEAGTAMNNDTTVSNASVILAQNADTGFNNNVDGNKWGKDLSSNISNGMTSQSSKSGITGAATSIAGWIKSIIGHSVPEAGPLKDELTYMPDMIDNLVKGIEKNRYKVVDATNQIAEGIKDGFDLEELNNDIIQEMNKAVAFETGSINATASVKSNNSMLNVIQATFNIDGSVAIDGQKAGRIITPYMTKTLQVGGAR